MDDFVSDEDEDDKDDVEKEEKKTKKVTLMKYYCFLLTSNVFSKCLNCIIWKSVYINVLITVILG